MKTIYDAYLEVNSKASRTQRVVGFYSMAKIRAAMGCDSTTFKKAVEQAMEAGDTRMDTGTWALATQEEREAALEFEGKRVLMMKIV
jgi:hypothetical protein